MKTSTNNTTVTTAAVKAQITAQFPQFTPVSPKIGDLNGVIGGKEYRVKIKSGEVLGVFADKQPVWTPDADTSVLEFIEKIVHPRAQAKKTAAPVETGVDKVKTAKVKVAKEPKEPQPEIDAAWIAKLEENANAACTLHTGDTVVFRVATSHGKPVCAHVDLYRMDSDQKREKIGTAGIHHRVGFARRGVDVKWTKQVQEAVQAIYRNLSKVTVLRQGSSQVEMDGNSVVKAHGKVKDILSILSTLSA
jgi:hypothetical protein